MLGLKRFLTFVADKGKKLVKDLFVKKKDTVDHLVDLCDELISESGVVSGITIAREIFIFYEKFSLEEKEKFFLIINKKYRPDYSAINKACRDFIHTNNEKNLSNLNLAVEGKRQELIRRLNLFVIQGIAPDISIGKILKGSLPFVLLMVLQIVILCIFPEIATWLPKAVMK